MLMVGDYVTAKTLRQLVSAFTMQSGTMMGHGHSPWDAGDFRDFGLVGGMAHTGRRVCQAMCHSYGTLGPCHQRENAHYSTNMPKKISRGDSCRSIR